MWLKQWYQLRFGQPRLCRDHRLQRRRLTLEALEDRMLPAVTIWTGANTLVDDNWSDPANWSSGVPGPSDTAEFNSDSAYSQFSTVDTSFTIAGLLFTPNAGGSMYVNAPLVLTGSSEWNAGPGLLINRSLGGHAINNGTLTLKGSGGGLGGSGIFTNNGTIVELSSGLNISGSSNNPSNPQATLDNASSGIIDMKSDVGILQSGFGYPVFSNEGTIKKTGGTGTSTINMPLTNTGVLDAESGTISLDSAGAVDTNGTFKTGTGAAIQLANGCDFTEKGTFTATGSGTLTVPQFASLSAGPIGATFKVASTVTFSLNGGSVNVPAGFALTYNGPLSIDGSGFASLGGGGAFIENGTITVSATGSPAGLAINDGGATPTILDIASGSTLDFRSDAGIFANCCGEGLEQISNEGTIEKTGGTGTSTISIPIDNSGVISVSTGTLHLTPLSGTLSNSQSVAIAAGSTLEVAGDYTQTATGSLQPILAGPPSFGQLQVSGKATLAGALKVSTANNFSPTAGQNFPVLTAGSLSGTFTTLSGVSFANGVLLQPAYSSTGVVLQASRTPVPVVAIPAISATAGQSFSGVVATVTDPAGGGLLAMIAWGDGQTSAGTVSANSDGTFSVRGTHTYAQPGSYAVMVTVDDTGDNQSATAGGMVMVQPVASNTGLSAARAGKAFMLMASVQGAGGTPSGSVEFFDTFQGKKRLLGAATVKGGVARMRVVLRRGVHALVAEYMGDGTFTSSISNFVRLRRVVS
jgi:hypothetical protein